MAKRRRKYDWETIEREYRAGHLSLDAISKAYGPVKSTIWERAKRYSWERDLTEQVRAGAKARLLKDAGKDPNDGPNTVRTRKDGEIVEANVDRVVGIVREHRASLSKAHGIVNLLFDELTSETTSIDDLREMVDEVVEERGGDAKQKATFKKQLMQALSLPGRAHSMRALAGALKDVVALERQAFNIDEERRDEDSVPLHERLKVYDREQSIDDSANVERMSERNSA